MKSTVQKYFKFAILGVGLLLIPPVFSAVNYIYAITILCFVTLYVIATSGLDILYGYCGQISLGHAAFFAIGAYGSVLLHSHAGIPVFFTMVIASVIAALIGAVIAYPASKLVFHFLSLATIAFAEIVRSVLLNSPGKITGNAVGLFTDPVSIFGLKLSTSTGFFYFGLIATVIFLVAKTFLINSRVGRAWTAIRDNPLAANGMGVNVTKYKVIAFAISAFYTGYAGAMYAHLVGYIGAETFVMKQSVMFLTMLLLGGSGSIVGPIIGTIIVLFLNESLRFLEQYLLLFYGILLLIVIVALPGGLYGYVKDLAKRIAGRGGNADVARN